MTGRRSGPLPAEWVAREQVSFDELVASGAALWWLQSDPGLGGDRRVMRWDGDGGPLPQTPPGFCVGGRLHAYGGGSFAAALDGLWAVSDEDSKVYRIHSGAEPELIGAEDGFQYGDLRLDDGSLLAVRGTDSVDEIVAIDQRGGGVRVLVSSQGFLAAPRLLNNRLAYLEWRADRMPWDSCWLRLTEIGSGGGPVRTVAGGEQESVVQPLWGPDGLLYFMSDRTGWWNLYRWDDGEVRAVAPVPADCAPAPWEGGYQSYVVTADGDIVLTVHDGIGTRLLRVDADGGQSRRASDLTSVKPYLAEFGEHIAVIGSTPASLPSVRLVDRAAPNDGAGIAVTEQGPAGVRIEYPLHRTVRSGDADVRFLLHVPEGGLPAPLIVRAHPGPTDDVPLRLDWRVQFFVSRGFAVAEVAYRGSTGQGRAFRQSLDGRWGEYDVQDCAAVAQDLLARDEVLPGAVFITGASAGGYTALQAACRPAPFTGATATSAITDPERWQKAVPRFQQPHAAALAGPAGAVRAENIQVPVLLIHGTDDDIARADDISQLADRLEALGRPARTLFLDGVGHYLSSPHALEQALLAELAFYEDVIQRSR